MLTRYATGRVELVEKLSCRPEVSFFCVFKALPDSFFCIGVGANVEQMLVSFSALNDGRGLAIHRKHNGTPTFFQLFHKVTRSATEGSETEGSESDLQEFGNGYSRSGTPRLEIFGN